jgi:predicted transcriptional regulator
MRYVQRKKREPHFKRSAYLKGDLRDQVQAEAKRLERSVSWVIQQCVKHELPNIQALDSQAKDTW